MFKTWLPNFVGILVLMMGFTNFAWAVVEVNKATQTALEDVKGIGPSTSSKIVDARTKGGPFKSWSDLADRVKGIGDKTAVKLSDAGLTVNGQSLPNAGVVPSYSTKSKPGSSSSPAATSPPLFPSSPKASPALNQRANSTPAR